MVFKSEEQRNADRRNNLKNAPSHVRVLSDWIVAELEIVFSASIEDGGFSRAEIKEMPETDRRRSCIPRLRLKMARKCPPNIDIPTEDILRTWRGAKHKKIPTKYLPVLAAYRGKGETTEMVRSWLLGYDADEAKVPPITPDQVWACDYGQTVWLLQTAAARLADLDRQPQEIKKRKS